MTERACQCTCEAWGHSPDACRGDAPTTLTAEPRDPGLDLWPAANVGEFKLCSACRRELHLLADKLQIWDMNMEAYGYPTHAMWVRAEIERLRARSGQ